MNIWGIGTIAARSAAEKIDFGTVNPAEKHEIFGKLGPSRREAPRKIFDFGPVKTVEKHEIFGKLEQSRREAPRKIFDVDSGKIV